MVPIYEPQNESEAAVIAAMMEAYGIQHFFQGGAFGQLMPGAVSTSLNTRTLMVEESQAALAKELLADFLRKPS